MPRQHSTQIHRQNMGRPPGGTPGQKLRKVGVACVTCVPCVLFVCVLLRAVSWCALHVQMRDPQHAAGMLTVCRSRSGGEGGSSCDEEKEGAGRRIGSEEGERRKAPSRTDLSAAPPRTDLTPSRRLVLILQHLVLSRTISCHCRSISYRSRSIWHQSRTISHGSRTIWTDIVAPHRTNLVAPHRTDLVAPS